MDPAQAQTTAAIIQAVAAIGQVGFTLVLVVVTWRYVLITAAQLKAATSPYVVVYLRHDDRRATLFQIVIENVGKGVANDIRFELSGPIPRLAKGHTEAEAPPAEPMTSGPLIDGITALGPGDKREMVWGQYGGLMKAIGEKGIQVKCRFKFGKEEMDPVYCTLDIKSFTGHDLVDHDGARRSAKHMERIADVMERKEAREDEQRWEEEQRQEEEDG